MTRKAVAQQRIVDRWRVSDGEEARLTPGGPAAAEIRSRGYLPLRQRSQGVAYLRAAFPGTAVLLGRHHYEVIAETEVEESVVYRLRVWPEGEIIRDQVTYDRELVRRAVAERERERVRARARPFRIFFYPLVGLLPEEAQERLCDRWGLYSVTATLISGIVESVVILSVLIKMPRLLSAGGSIAIVVLAPGVVYLLVLPGLARAFEAAAFRETRGFWLFSLVTGIAEALGFSKTARDRTLVPLSRKAFWIRLAQPDRVTKEEDGSLIYTCALSHLTWLPGRHIQADEDHWRAVALPPTFRHGRLGYRYRLELVGDPPPPGSAPPAAPSPLAYSEEVLAQVQREWDDLLKAFTAIVSMLPSAVQRRALERRGGPAAIKTATLATSVVCIALALYALHFLPGSPGDPLAPLVGVLGITLLCDGAYRLYRRSIGEYAPSVLRFVLPCDSLRPERIAYHAHRDAEREILSRPLG